MTIARMVKLGRKGQMVLPKEVRDSLGVKEGDHLVVTLQGEEALLITPERYARMTEGLLKGMWGKSKEGLEDYLERERHSWEEG